MWKKAITTIVGAIFIGFMFIQLLVGSLCVADQLAQYEANAVTRFLTGLVLVVLLFEVPIIGLVAAKMFSYVEGNNNSKTRS